MVAYPLQDLYDAVCRIKIASCSQTLRLVSMPQRMGNAALQVISRSSSHSLPSLGLMVTKRQVCLTVW